MDVFLRLLFLLYITWCIIVNIHSSSFPLEESQEEEEDAQNFLAEGNPETKTATRSEIKERKQESQDAKQDEILSMLKAVTEELALLRKPQPQDLTTPLTKLQESLSFLLFEVASLKRAAKTQQQHHEELKTHFQTLKEMRAEGVGRSFNKITCRLEGIKDTLSRQSQCLSEILTTLVVTRSSPMKSKSSSLPPTPLPPPSHPPLSLLPTENQNQTLTLLQTTQIRSQTAEHRLLNLQEENQKLQERWIENLNNVGSHPDTQPNHSDHLPAHQSNKAVSGEGRGVEVTGELRRHLRDAEREIVRLKADVVGLRMLVRRDYYQDVRGEDEGKWEREDGGGGRGSGNGSGKNRSEGGSDGSDEQMEMITIEQMRVRDGKEGV